MVNGLYELLTISRRNWRKSQLRSIATLGEICETEDR